MGETAITRMSIDEFFAWQSNQEELYELVGGIPVPKSMTGATYFHDLVVVNAIGSLWSRLAGGPCRPTTDDLAVKTMSGSIRRPDVAVDCQPPREGAREVGQPSLALEVLSPSTAQIDKFVKLEEYKAISSMLYILIADAGRAHVVVYVRDPSSRWSQISYVGRDAVIPLPALGCDLPLADLYRNVPDVA